MFVRVLNGIVVLFVFLFLISPNLFASVADLHLKLPFPAGETWRTSCAYNGTGPCKTHATYTASGRLNKDRYALDFNHYDSDGRSDDLGKSIRAAASGRAEIHYGNRGYGNYVLLHHGDGYVTRYAHLQSISVKQNQWVLQGQEVGKCGSTGNSSSPHLHFALYHNGQATKPEPMGGYSDFSSSGNYYASANGDPVFRTVAYESDEFKGALVLVRENGQLPQEDCQNIAQTIFYRQWRENGHWSNAMEVVSLDEGSSAYETCLEASYGGFNDVNLEDVIDGFNLKAGGHGGSSGNTDDSNTSNPWSGYAHHVGLKYIKIGKKSSGHWSDSKTWTKGEIPSKRDFRIKLKQKGSVWPDGNTCAEVWFSHNKHFTNKDLFLGKKCKNLSDETEDERSIYVEDVHLPTMEAGEDYYFFTVVTYPGGVNPSSEDDHDEYVKTIITDNSAYTHSPCGQAGYTKEECFSLLMTILNNK